MSQRRRQRKLFFFMACKAYDINVTREENDEWRRVNVCWA